MESNTTLCKTLSAILTISIILSGCTSTKIVQPNLTSNPVTGQKLPASIAIEGIKTKGAKITITPGSVELTAEYGDAFLESIRHALSSRFEKVVIVDTLKGIDKYDYVAHVSNKIRGVCEQASCTLYSETPLVVKNAKSESILTEKKIDDVIFWTIPSGKGIGVIRFFMIIPPLVLAPILLPIGVDIECDELVRVMSEANDNAADKILSTILSTKDIK